MAQARGVMVSSQDLIYQPAEDSWLLARYVQKYAPGKKVLDMGTGSGIQALAAQQAGALSVLAVDLHRKALAEVKKKGIPTLFSNLFSNVKGTFNLIVCNPPYLPQDPLEDLVSARATTGGKKGDEWILRFLKQVPQHLAPEGTILLLLSSLTPRTRIHALLKKQKLHKKVLVVKNLFMEKLEVWALRSTFKNLEEPFLSWTTPPSET